MVQTKILIVEPYGFSRGGGNITTQTYIMKFTEKSKFKLFLLTPSESEFTDISRGYGVSCIIETLPKRLVRYGGEYKRGSFVDKLFMVGDILRYNFRILKKIKELDTNVVYCNCIRAFLYVGLAALLARKPIFLYIKGELENPLLDVLGICFSKRIVFISKSNISDKYSFLGNLFNRKIRVVENGIDVEEIMAAIISDKSSLVKELNIDSNKINLICLGFIYPLKGIHFLLEALRIIKNKQLPDFVLYVVGDLPLDKWRSYKTGLVEFVHRYSLESNVVFTGWRSNALNILYLMDILVHPSTSEGFPAVLLEAMAMEKSVVATRVGGARDLIVDGKNGYLVEPCKPDAIANKLEMLLKSPELRTAIGQEGKRTVFSNYIINDKVSQIGQIWQEMSA